MNVFLNFRSVSKFLLLFLTIASATSLRALEIAITIDDLPYIGTKQYKTKYSDIAQKMISSFQSQDITDVVGFLNGSRGLFDPESITILGKWKANGHKLGNHTFSHLNLSTTPADQYNNDITKNHRLLIKKHKSAFAPYFRYAYLREGSTAKRRNLVRKHIKNLGLKIAPVTIDFNDYLWAKPFVRCSKTKNKAELKKLKKMYIAEATAQLEGSIALSKSLVGRDIKHIALVHINEFSSLMLNSLLKKWKSMGAKFISLEEALKDKIYDINPDLPGANWTFLNKLRLFKKKEVPEAVKKIYMQTDKIEKDLEKVCI